MDVKYEGQVYSVEVEFVNEPLEFDLNNENEYELIIRSVELDGEDALDSLNDNEDFLEEVYVAFEKQCKAQRNKW